MLSKIVTLCGRPVNLAYCFATEIAFRDLSGEAITDYIRQAVPDMQAGRMPDVRKTVLLIVAAAVAYSQAKNEEAPVADRDILSEATPEELGAALGILIGLYLEFYRIPAGTLSKQEDEAGKEQQEDPRGNVSQPANSTNIS